MPSPPARMFGRVQPAAVRAQGGAWGPTKHNAAPPPSPPSRWRCVTERPGAHRQHTSPLSPPSGAAAAYTPCQASTHTLSCARTNSEASPPLPRGQCRVRATAAKQESPTCAPRRMGATSHRSHPPPPDCLQDADAPGRGPAPHHDVPQKPARCTSTPLILPQTPPPPSKSQHRHQTRVHALRAAEAELRLPESNRNALLSMTTTTTTATTAAAQAYMVAAAAAQRRRRPRVTCTLYTRRRRRPLTAPPPPQRSRPRRRAPPPRPRRRRAPPRPAAAAPRPQTARPGSSPAPP